MTTHSWQCWGGRSARRRGRGRGTWGRCRSGKPCSNRQDERWKLWHLRLNLMHFSNHVVLLLLPLPHYTESRGQKQRWMAFQNVSLSQERKKKMRSNSAVNVMLFPPQFIEIAKQQWILAKKILHQLSVPNIYLKEIWLQICIFFPHFLKCQQLLLKSLPFPSTTCIEAGLCWFSYFEGNIVCCWQDLKAALYFWDWLRAGKLHQKRSKVLSYLMFLTFLKNIWIFKCVILSRLKKGQNRG